MEEIRLKCPYCGFDISINTKSNTNDIECINCFSPFSCIDGRTVPSIRSTTRIWINKFFQMCLFISAITGLFIVLPSLLLAFNILIDFLNKNRSIFGFPTYENKFDVYLAGGITLTCLIVVLIFLIINYFYWKLFTLKRPQALKLPRHLQKVISFKKSRQRALLQAEYIAYITKSSSSTHLIPDHLKEQHANLDNVRGAATAILTEQSKWIRNHALLTGLAVGISQKTLYDRIILAFSSWSMYREVLRRLGKRPTMSLNIKAMQYAFGSLAINTFLQGNDAFLVKLAVKSIGWGVGAIGDIIDTAPELLEEWGDDLQDLLSDLELDDDIDEFIDTLQNAMGSAGGGDVLAFIKGGASMSLAALQFSLGIGKNAAVKIWDATDEYADDILQGIIASAFLYNLGMKTAVHCLAIDKQHLSEKKMSYSFSKALYSMIPEGGELLRQCLKKTRKLFKKKRKEVIRKTEEILPEKLRPSKYLKNRKKSRKDELDT